MWDVTPKINFQEIKDVHKATRLLYIKPKQPIHSTSRIGFMNYGTSMQ